MMSPSAPTKYKMKKKHTFPREAKSMSEEEPDGELLGMPLEKTPPKDKKSMKN